MQDFNKEFKDVPYDELVNLINQKSPKKEVNTKDLFSKTEATIEKQYSEIMVLLDNNITLSSLRDIESKLNALNENLVSLLFSHANIDDENLRINNSKLYDKYKGKVALIIKRVTQGRAQAEFKILDSNIQKIISDNTLTDPKKLITCIDIMIVNLSILKIKFEEQLSNLEVIEAIKSANLNIATFISSMKKQLSESEISQARVYSSVEKKLQELEQRYSEIDIDEVDRDYLEDLNTEVTSLKKCLDDMNENSIDWFKSPMLNLAVRTNLTRYLNFRYNTISNIEDDILQAEENICFDAPDFCNVDASDFDIEDYDLTPPSTPKLK